jgi:hypothetical protein
MPGTRVHGADNDLPRMPKPAVSAHAAWRCQPISRASIGLYGFANPEFQRTEKISVSVPGRKKNIGVRSRKWTSLNFLIF